MGTNTRYRLALWAVLALVVLNVCLLGLLWHEHFRQPPPPAQDARTGAEEFLGREVQLDQSQADSVRQLRRNHFLQTDSIRVEIVHLSMRMMDELFAPTPDTALVRELSEQMGRRQAEFERRVYGHFDEIKGILRPDQYDKLRQLIFDGLRRKLPTAEVAEQGRPQVGEPGSARPDDQRTPQPDDRRPPPPRDDRPPQGR
jgi:hypothetical protein